jgi:ABC-type dipeptide/oligopeptide/nickel transport system permease subunit
LLSDGSLESIAVALGNVSVRGNLESTSVDFAFSLNSGVWVSLFGGDTVGNDVLESVIHNTSVASLVSV